MQSYKLPLKFPECLGSPVRFGDRRVTRRLFRVLPDDLRLRTLDGRDRRGLFDRREGDLRRGGMCACVINE